MSASFSFSLNGETKIEGCTNSNSSRVIAKIKQSLLLTCLFFNYLNLFAVVHKIGFTVKESIPLIMSYSLGFQFKNC